MTNVETHKLKAVIQIIGRDDIIKVPAIRKSYEKITCKRPYGTAMFMVSIRVPEDYLVALENAAKQYNVAKSAIIRHGITCALRELGIEIDDVDKGRWEEYLRRVRASAHDATH